MQLHVICVHITKYTKPIWIEPFPICYSINTGGDPVDNKIRTKIYGGKYVKLSSLLPKDFNMPEWNEYKSIDNDDQLLFVKLSNKDPIKIKVMVKLTKAFHNYVAIVAEEKNPAKNYSI